MRKTNKVFVFIVVSNHMFSKNKYDLVFLLLLLIWVFESACMHLD